jgi:hypothetical protein
MRGRGWRGGALGAGVAGAIVLLGAATAAPASAARVRRSPRDIVPIIECSVTRSGSTRSLFGYRNSGQATTVPVGPANAFTPGPSDRGQPTTFESGTRINVFTATGQHLRWNLGGNHVSVPGPACQATPASSTLAGWGPVFAIVAVTGVLGALLFWRTRRYRTVSA